jgi:hypothetical protein
MRRVGAIVRAEDVLVDDEEVCKLEVSIELQSGGHEELEMIKDDFDNFEKRPSFLKQNGK